MDTPVIDMHSHVGNESKFGMIGDPELYLSVLDAAGVDRAPVSCLFYGDVSRCNDETAAFVARNPDRFMGVAFVTPYYPEEAIDELERAFDVLGMVFLKLYPSYVFKPIDDEVYAPILDWCNKRSIIVKCHTQYDTSSLRSAGSNTYTEPTDPSRFIGLAQLYPNIRWVLAHAGNSREGQLRAVEAAKSSRNIYLETCTSLADHGTIERLVEGAGADRVLYGSDMPLMDARMQIGRIATANISNDAKRRVLGLNAMELLGISSV
ncbi:amidohydrolase family protein [Dehalococcoidia bacterium]|nr:amidohydrolase family protein [Dehalococcoidia bacterium]